MFITTLNPDVRSSSSLISTIVEGIAVIHTDEKIPKKIAIKIDVQSSPRNVIASGAIAPIPRYIFKIIDGMLKITPFQMYD